MSLRLAPTAVLAHAGRLTNRTFVLPIVLFAPTQRCHSACVSCAWWQTPSTARGDELSVDEVHAMADELESLGTRLVVFTGGEPLLRGDLLSLAVPFVERGIACHLLTSGVGLGRRADAIARVFTKVIVSLDGSTRESYRAIRGVDAFDAVAAGVDRLRAAAPALSIVARSTLHARNFREMSALAACARRIGCSGISFLAADVASSAFGPRRLDETWRLGLSRDETAEFVGIIDRVIAEWSSGAAPFIAERPAKLRQLAQYFAALNGDAAFPPKACNAPWMSAVIEANGDVRPCFFHPVVGNLRSDGLTTIVRTALPSFRAALDVAADPTCERCVCSLNLRWRDRPWA